MFQTLEQSIEGFSYRYTREKFHEFIFRAVTPVEIDAWVTVIEQVRPLIVQHDLHMCALYDLRGQWPTPYGTRQALMILRVQPATLRLSSALLINDQPIAVTLVQMILRQIPLNAVQAHQVFTTDEAARRWLIGRRAALWQPQDALEADH